MNHNIITLILVLLSSFSFIDFVRAQCDYSSNNGDYKVSWYVEKDSPKNVHFKLEAKQRTTTGFWTGIGFGSGMSGGDFIIVNTVGDTVSVTDRHGVGFSEPIVDTQQNVRVGKTSVNNGIVKAEFSRAIDTGDPNDSPLADPNNKNCQNFIFPESGGGSSTIQSIRQHKTTPITKSICNIDTCSSGNAQVDANVDKPALTDSSRSQIPTDTLNGDRNPNPSHENPVDATTNIPGLVGERRRPFGLPVPSSPPGNEPLPRDNTGSSNGNNGEVLPQATAGVLPNRGPVEEGAPTNPIVQPVDISGVNQGQQAACPARLDHRSCQNYIETYLGTVFTKFERNSVNTQKACNLLIAQQQGLVKRECCNYLSQPQICRQFLLRSS